MKARALIQTAIALFLFLPAIASAAVVGAPIFIPGGGIYFDSVDVAIFSETPGATIYYTTDGSTPDPDNRATTEPFTLPFTLAEPTTVKAIAVKAGDTDSAVTPGFFNVVPTEEIPTPTVTISGKKSLKTKKAKIKIRGTATGAIEVDYQVGADGDYKVASGTSAWSFAAKLKPGKNVIYVYAIGEEEDSDPAKITVTLVKKK